jgi:hypothetical protein
LSRHRLRKFIFSLSAGERIIASGITFTVAAIFQGLLAAICIAKNPEQIDLSLKTKADQAPDDA